MLSQLTLEHDILTWNWFDLLIIKMIYYFLLQEQLESRSCFADEKGSKLKPVFPWLAVLHDTHVSQAAVFLSTPLKVDYVQVCFLICLLVIWQILYQSDWN